MDSGDRLQLLKALLADPVALEATCETWEVADLGTFLAVELPETEPSKALQTALRRSRRSHAHGETQGLAELSRLIGAPARDLAALLTGRLLPEWSASRMARWALAEVGGVSGAAHLAGRMTELTGEVFSVRRLRSTLRGRAVRKLGGGYYALQYALAEPLVVWVSYEIAAQGPQPMDALIHKILRTYPHGDAYAVRRWLQQDPGPLQHQGGTVRLLTKNWKIR